MATLNVKELFSIRTAQEILDLGLGVAAFLGLLVTSWRTGDPTRTYYVFLSEAVASLEARRAEMAKAMSIESAEGEWLEARASEVFEVEATEETFATPTIVLHNGGGGQYPIDVGEKTFKASTTGATFHNTSILAGVSPLIPGQSIILQLVADVAGSVSTVGPNDIDEIVTTMLGVTVTSSTAAVGADAQEDESIRQACRDSRGALSPAGAADAYQFVATSTKLTGLPAGAITRATSTNDAVNGVLSLYVCDADGDAAPADITAVEVAIMKWCNPITATPGVGAATKVYVAASVQIHGENVPADIEDQIIAIALGPFFAAQRIAGDAGAVVDRSQLIAVIHNACRTLGIPLAGSSVTLVTPASNVVLTLGQVPALGAVSVVEV